MSEHSLRVWLIVMSMALLFVIWLDTAGNNGDLIDLDDGRQVISICDSGPFDCPWFYVGDEVSVSKQTVITPTERTP